MPRERRSAPCESAASVIDPPGHEATITPGSTVDLVGIVDEIERLTRGSSSLAVARYSLL